VRLADEGGTQKEGGLTREMGWGGKGKSVGNEGGGREEKGRQGDSGGG